MSHTPGPWHWEHGVLWAEYGTDGAARRRVLGMAPAFDKYESDYFQRPSKADAALLAAAPELLAALETILADVAACAKHNGEDMGAKKPQFCEDLINIDATARAAIAKAKGGAK